MRAIYWLGVGLTSLVFAIYLGIATWGQKSLIIYALMSLLLGMSVYSIIKMQREAEKE